MVFGQSLEGSTWITVGNTLPTDSGLSLSSSLEGCTFIPSGNALEKARVTNINATSQYVTQSLKNKLLSVSKPISHNHSSNSSRNDFTL